MTREEMLTNIVRHFGFEHPVTARFNWLVEHYMSDKAVQVAYNIIMARVKRGTLS